MDEQNKIRMPLGLKMVIALAIISAVFCLFAITVVAHLLNYSLIQFLFANLYIIPFPILLIIDIIYLIKRKKWARILGIITFLAISIVYLYVGLVSVLDVFNVNTATASSILIGLINIFIAAHLLFSKKIKAALN